jgi:hypothetical protein
VEDILYLVGKTHVTFYGNTIVGVHWLSENTGHNPHKIKNDFLKEFLQELKDNLITYECIYRVPEL